MAANFWTSTHYKQLLDPEEVDAVHPLDKEKGITVDNFKLIKLHLANYIWKLAPSVKGRQRLVATAITYMRRVYTRKSMSEYDPRLVAPTCLYLASKAEESMVQAKLLVFCIRKQYADDKYRFEIKDTLEMEMRILEALNYYLVVFHPYRSLSHCELGEGTKQRNKAHFLPCFLLLQFPLLSWNLPSVLAWLFHSFRLAGGKVHSGCWHGRYDLIYLGSFDTYKMDLILANPPHLIALSCIYIASVYKDRDTTAWFEELRVDMNAVKNIAMEILDFYENNKMCPEEKVAACLSKLALKPQI